MASNISVTLVIDNKQYIADLRAAESATKKFGDAAAKTADASSGSFTRLNNSSQGLSLNLGRLSTVAGAALAAGFVATAKSAIVMADGIADLSQATGIAIEKIVQLQAATAAAGGNAEGAAKGLTYFYTQIDAAAEGSARTQAAFADLNISLQDLRMLSESALLQKTVDELAKLEPSARKTTLQGELLGKAFRNVTIDAEFAARLRAGDEASKKLADSIQRAADLNDRFNESWTKLRLAFLEAFGPMIDGLAKMAEVLVRLPGLVEVLSLALLAIPGMAVGRALVASTSFMAKGLAALAGRAETAKKAVGGLLGAGTSAASQRIRNIGSAVGGIGAVVVGGAAMGMGKSAAAESDSERAKQTAAQDAAAEKAKKEAQAQREVQSALAKKRLEVQALFTEYQRANQAQIDAINLDSRLIGVSKSAADQERARAEVLKRSEEEIQKLTAAKAAMSAEDRKLGLGASYDQQIKKIREVQQSEADRAAAAVENNNRLITLEKQRQFGIQQEISLQQQLTRLQDDIVTQLLPEMERRYYAIGAAARAAAASEIAAEEQRLGRKLNTQEVETYYRIAAQGADKLKEKTLELLQVESARNLAQFGIKTRIDDENRLLQIQDDMAKLTLPEIEKKYYDIAAAARDSAKAAIEAEEARLGRTLSASEAKKYYDAASAGSTKLSKQTKALYEQSRTFATGWKQAFNAYRDAATNSAAAATRVFDKFVGGLEDALVDFVKTGRFEWRSFVDGMLEELLRSQLKKTFASIGDAFGLGGLFGGGSGQGSAPGDAPSNPSFTYIVNGGDMGMIGSMAGGTGGGGILGGIFGGGSGAPSTTSGGGIGGGLGGIIGTIGSGISSVVGGISDAVGSIFSGGDSGGGLFSGISDLFSGFFANGGNIPQGRFGIAGERGPELIGGPASVTPMSGTTVTYNINAVDAASFQALVARDPSFIHAVAQAGARGMPQRR